MNFNRSRFLIVFGACLLFVGAAVGGYFWTSTKPTSEEAGSVWLPVPEEIAITFSHQFSSLRIATQTHTMPDVPFLGPDGQERSWDDFKGKYLLVNFWATWCGPCVLELPSLEKLRAKYADQDINIIAISVDHHKDMELLGVFLKNRNIADFALYYDHQAGIRENVPMRGIPTSYLIDASGEILYVFEGDADWTSPDALAFFDALLKPKQ